MKCISYCNREKLSGSKLLHWQKIILVFLFAVDNSLWVICVSDGTRKRESYLFVMCAYCSTCLCNRYAGMYDLEHLFYFSSETSTSVSVLSRCSINMMVLLLSFTILHVTHFVLSVFLSAFMLIADGGSAKHVLSCTKTYYSLPHSALYVFLLWLTRSSTLKQYSFMYTPHRACTSRFRHGVIYYCCVTHKIKCSRWNLTLYAVALVKNSVLPLLFFFVHKGAFVVE